MLKAGYLILGLSVGALLLDSGPVLAKELVREARVIMVKGDVNIQKAGKTDWAKAKEGMILTDGDTAKTGKSSAVEIAFDRDKKNIVRLDENSTAILRGKMLRQVELPRGKIRFVVKSLKKDSSFEIKTPTVVAGARGSGGDVIAGENMDTVKAFEDELFVQSFDEQGNLIQEISLKEGWEVMIERFEAPGELIEVTDMDRSDWGSWKDDLGGRIDESIREEQPSPISQDFSNVESIQQETIQKQEEYKQDVIQQQDTQRIEQTIEEEQPAPEPPCDDPY